MQVQLAVTTEQISDCFAVIQHLRPALQKDQFVEQVKQQQKDGYQLAYICLNEQVVAVAGFVIGLKLAWGRHMYIDDLVTDPQVRSHGVGKALLDWLSDYGVEKGCQQLHLDSGVQRHGAHKFYLREGFSITSHHFYREL